MKPAVQFILGLALLFHSYAMAQSYTWNTVSMGGGGFVSGLVTSKKDPNVVYARTDVGGAYRWDNSASKWVPLLDWVNTAQGGYSGVESIAIDPRNSAIVYMLAGTIYTNNGATAILKSTDNGASFSVKDVTSQFKAHGNGSGRGNGEKLQVDPNDGNILWCGTRENGLFKSTDAGATWARDTSLPIRTTKVYYGGIGTGISFVLLDSANGTTGSATPDIYVGVATVDSASNLYFSKDGGLSFNPVPLTGGPDPQRVMPARASLAVNGILYITYDSLAGPGNEVAASGAVWKYNTITGVWTKITPANGLAYGGVSVDPHNPLRIIVSTVNTYKAQYVSGSVIYGDRFYLSTDGGASWRNLVPTNSNNVNIALDANGIPWITGQSIHWAGSIEFNPFNTNQAWVNSGNGVFFCSDLSAPLNTWKFVVQGIEETVANDMVSLPGGPFFSVVSDYDGFKQTDVKQYSVTGRYSPSTGTTNGIAYAALQTNRLVRVGGSMFYTSDQGVTWTKTASTGGNGTNGKLALDANGNTILHCPTGSNSGNYTYRSADNGNTWTICSRISINSAVPVADPVNTNRFYAYNNGNGYVLRSNDNGISFSDSFFVGTGGSKLIRTAPGYEGHLWMAMNNGGLKRITAWGAATTISGVTACSAVGLGKAEPSSSYYTVYIWGTVNGVTGIHRSTDQGLTWVRINDDEHEYGGPGNGQFVMGDMNVYGRAYMSTAGRGIVYGELNTALPVALLSFSGRVIQQNQVSLQWKTAAETNNNHFDLERSADGATFAKVASIATLAFNGNSSVPVQYSYTDDTYNLSGTVWYRLKQVDKDDTYFYSGVIAIINNVHGIDAVQAFPNPSVSDNISLKIQLSMARKVSIQIASLSGSLVYKGEITELTAGMNLLKLHNTVIRSKGTYVVQVIDEGNDVVIARNKMIVQ